MKYLVLIYTDSHASWTGSEQEQRDLTALFALRDELAATGELISSEGLAMPRDGKVVRVRAGERLVEDGPFGAVQDQVAGFFLIDCATDERAEEVAGRVSALVRDRVEVRGVILSG